MSICPEGHRSESDDYCDTCGTPIVAGASASATPSAPSGPAVVAPPADGIPCPHCGVENVPDALFCEACGYDFTTGTLPRPMANPFALPGDEEPAPVTTPAPAVTPAPAATPTPPASPTLPASSDPDAADQPAAEGSGADGATADEAAADEPAVDDVDDFANFPVASPDSGGYDAPAPGSGYDAGSAPAGGYDSSPTPETGVDLPVEMPGGYDSPAPAASPASAQPDRQPPAQPDPGAPAAEVDDASTFTWVAEVWIDPDWYRKQQPPDPMPSPGLPEVVPLRRRSVLIGRVSRSRNIHPDIDCDSDPGASRRQAQLTTDGRRWWVEDLDSANGTYVAGAADGLPDEPIRVGQRHELDPDDRIYLGAWTRLVIRHATEEELEAY